MRQLTIFAFAISALTLISCEDEKESSPTAPKAAKEVRAPATSTAFLNIPSEGDWLPAQANKLQVAVLEPGTGDVVRAGDQITCHYRGQFWKNGTRGKTFDASYDRGEPATFPIGVGSVIPGWDRALVGQKVGCKVVVIIPSDLAYGPQGRPPLIPGNSPLVFDVEILAAQGSR